MMSIIRTAAKLCIVALALLAFVAPVSAASVTFLANPPAGDDNNPCTFASPCNTPLTPVENGLVDSNGQITCAQGTAFGVVFPAVQSVTIDCSGLFVPSQTAIGAQTTGTVIKIRHLTFNGQFAGNGSGGVSITGGSGGVLVLEDCVFENFSGTAIQIAANGPYTLILRNTRMVDNGAGVVLKPAAGGSINATFDHVTISRNNGGGLRADSSNGPITVDIIDSVIADNVSNGLNISSGTGTQNDMVNLTRTTIAKNGLVGIQTGGNNAAVLLNASTLDSNTSGATLASNGGRIISYGNNQIIGTPGSGFTGSTPLQ